MKKYFLLASLLVAQISVKAQYKPEDIVRNSILSESIIYEDNDTNKLGTYYRFNQDNATETGSILHGKKTGDWYFFDLKGSLMFRGHYNAGLKSGKWEYFDETGVLRTEIYYKNGLADSVWTGYSVYKLPLYKATYRLGGIVDTLITYNENGINSLKMTYRNGSPYSVIGEWDIYGNPLDAGSFKYGTGFLKRYYPYGQLFSSEQYNGGALNGEAYYLNVDGTKKARGVFVDNTKADVWYYQNFDGTEVPFSTVGKSTSPFDTNMSIDTLNKSLYSVAEFPGGKKAIDEYFGFNQYYPDEAKKLKIEGTVWMNFEVDEIGHIHDVKIFSRIGEGCDEEAEFLVKNFPNWRPALQQGIPVKSRVFFPVVFKLK